MIVRTIQLLMKCSVQMYSETSMSFQKGQKLLDTSEPGDALKRDLKESFYGGRFPTIDRYRSLVQNADPQLGTVVYQIQRIIAASNIQGVSISFTLATRWIRILFLICDTDVSHKTHGYTH